MGKDTGDEPPQGAGEVVRANFGGSPFRELEEIEAEIWTAIMQFEGRVSTMAVCGVLDLVKLKLLDPSK